MWFRLNDRPFVQGTYIKLSFQFFKNGTDFINKLRDDLFVIDFKKWLGLRGGRYKLSDGRYKLSDGSRQKTYKIFQRWKFQRRLSMS